MFFSLLIVMRLMWPVFVSWCCSSRREVCSFHDFGSECICPSLVSGSENTLDDGIRLFHAQHRFNLIVVILEFIVFCLQSENIGVNKYVHFCLRCTLVTRTVTRGEWMLQVLISGCVLLVSDPHTTGSSCVIRRFAQENVLSTDPCRS